MELRSDLHRRTELAYAHLVVDDVEPTEAVMLACDLLAADVDGESTVRLAIASAVSLPPYAAERMLRDMLVELGIPEPDPGRAARLASASICAQIMNGTLRAERGGHRLLGTLAQLAEAEAEAGAGAGTGAEAGAGTGAKADAEAGADAYNEAVARLLRLLDRLEYDLAGEADAAFDEDLRRLASDLAARIERS
ncbi:hypothetical protein I0C86_17785 [Plantactinospora sp. S1510]|uniref:Uncharacterized protein n=1 Tax=Plantactinospora alkalitolerans TaxID=2789879 RepID=A0ABS0GX82_9ACTN|nr:hypothetical protein [Plantactinospora alkalitolerans]MBF9130796.1 hypothetical protein [Plantactinospora alkalitolerans]